MHKTQAKLMIYQELSKQTRSTFDFGCMKDGKIVESSWRVDMWHLVFHVGEPLQQLQVTLDFQEKWVDVLAFPHPYIVDEDHVLEMIRFVNDLNGYVKLQDSNGRFYVHEEDLDVAYSSRISYKYLECLLPEAVHHGVLGFGGFVTDAAVPLYQVGRGEMTAAEASRYMEELWEN